MEFKLENLLSDKMFNFLNEEFPNHATEIRESIELLESTLQTTIDAIEDKSNEIIKRDRNFIVAGNYRKYENDLNIISMQLQNIGEMLNDEIEDVEESEDSESGDNLKEIPNYSEYAVDSEVQHNLYEDFTHKRPCCFELLGKKVIIKDWKEMLIECCNILITYDRDKMLSFPTNRKMQGKKVKYFAYSEDEIPRAPKKIKGAELYVSTNHSANSIRNMITKILKEFGIPVIDFKVYLRADYSDLH